MRKNVKANAGRVSRKDRPATRRDIQALAMGMAGNIDNLAIGLATAVRFMQKQHRDLLRETAKRRRGA